MIVRGTVRGGGEGKDGEGRGGIGEGARGAGSSEEERAEASAARDELAQDARDRGRMMLCSQLQIPWRIRIFKNLGRVNSKSKLEFVRNDAIARIDALAAIVVRRWR